MILSKYTIHNRANTVTYGHVPASFLAMSCLFHQAEEIQEVKPHISRIIKHDFYADGMLTGADSIEGAKNICHSLSQVLRNGCFALRKWFSKIPTS